MEEAREMMKRIEWEWNKKRPSMSEEHDEILELLVTPASTRDLCGMRRTSRPGPCGGWTSWAGPVRSSWTSRGGGRRSGRRPRC